MNLCILKDGGPIHKQNNDRSTTVPYKYVCMYMSIKKKLYQSSFLWNTAFKHDNNDSIFSNFCTWRGSQNHTALSMKRRKDIRMKAFEVTKMILEANFSLRKQVIFYSVGKILFSTSSTPKKIMGGNGQKPPFPTMSEERTQRKTVSLCICGLFVHTALTD